MDADAFLGLTQGSPQNLGLEAPEPKVAEPEPVDESSYPALQGLEAISNARCGFEIDRTPVAEMAERLGLEGEIIFSNHTPSGILVEYCPNPRFYRVNGTEVPSVTTVLDVLQKGGLPWWGMQVGIQGVIELFDMGLLTVLTDFPDTTERLSIRGESQFADAARIVQELTAQKLTVNHARDKAGDRGTTVHDVFEQWCKTGEKISSNFLSPDEQGYVDGLIAFLRDSDAKARDSEVMVGSADHGFAGRFDAVLEMDSDQVVVKHRKRGTLTHPARGVHLVDLKTSKGVYPETHFRQLEAYEAAAVECGYQPTDARYLLHVTADGGYEYVKSTASFDDFLAVLSVWKSNQRIKGK